MSAVENNFEQLLTLISNGFGPSKLFSLDWLNEICSHLTRVCKDTHQFLANKQLKLPRNAIETVFLALRQLTCCINNLEKIAVLERQQSINLKLCRQHFQERMSFCLKRLNDILMSDATQLEKFTTNEASFVSYMDQTIDSVTPLSLQLAFSVENENKPTIEITETKFIKSSRQIRQFVELLIGQTLAFIGIVSKNDKIALNAYCHLVMKECIELQEMCLGYDSNDQEINASERDKRLQAQKLLNALYSLDRLMNECFLRVFYTTFADFQLNPILQLHELRSGSSSSEKHVREQFNDLFDDILDRLIQIGIFSTAYTSNPKAKSHLQSCMATFEALSVNLVSSIASTQFEHDAAYLEKHWNETVNQFRCSVHEIINTQAFSMVLIDSMYESLSDLTESSIDRSALKAILNRCNVLYEHIQINANELQLNRESQLKLYADDFRMMMSECKACINTKIDIDVKRIRKRFNILLSVIKNIAKVSVPIPAKGDNDQENKPFTFGDVTAPTDDMALKTMNDSDVGQIAPNESMAVIVDLNEFISKNETVHKQLTHRSEVFYQPGHGKKMIPRFSMVASVGKTPLKKDMHNSKRVSKRISLRVAMFKRQKFLDTQKFLNDITTKSNDSLPVDSLNLQITDILDQLSFNHSSNMVLGEGDENKAGAE